MGLQDSFKSERKIDGMDITSLLGSTEKPVREIFHIRTKAVIKGHWKLHGKELFNLKEDISEKKNVAAQHPEIVKELKARSPSAIKRSP